MSLARSRTLRHLAVAAALAAACVMTPAQAAGQSAQNEARAPELKGLGNIHMPVTTENARAQAFFNQGLRLLYGFNHQESRRAFEEAARLDANLAMAYWGVALTLAPNLNAPMSAEQGRAALDAIRTARRLATRSSPREQGLINALAARFAEDPAAPRAPFDRAYADAMTRVAAAFPDDADVVTLYADAVMNTMPWDYYQTDGSAKPETTLVSAALERAIARQPDHAGAHHYYIHLWEASKTPERAEASADRLGGLMPAAGHMVHMPAHIYLRVGRYADAAEANVRAIAADEDYLAQCQAQGLYPISYYPHNLHFLWAAATLEGRGAVAVDAARQVAAKVPHHHAGKVAWTADFPVTPMLAYVRFGRWQEMLTEPMPPPDQPYAIGIWHYGRGLGFIARDQNARAAVELEALTKILEHEAFRTTLKDTPLVINLQMASRIVAAEIAARTNKFDDAIRVMSEAVALEDAMPYSEPPLWHQPTRQVLGAILIDAGRFKEAEAVYRRDLEQVRENGWSLFGLWQSLRAQDRAGEAAIARARFDRAWARADVTLTASRMLGGPRGHRSRTADRAKERIMIKSVALPSGITLEYAERGKASGIPVIFLHGVTDSWRSFEPVLEQLPTTIRAFSITARGHGESSKPESGFLYSDMAGDVRAFMEVMKLPAAILVGHSMGASVAQRFALDYPDRLAGLVLMGAFSTIYGDASLQAFYDSALAELQDPVPAGLARDFQVSTIARDVPPELVDVAVSESLKVPARIWRALFKGFLNTPDFTRDLARVEVPTLLVWGDQDAYAVRKHQDVLLAAIPGSRLVAYEGNGHAMHWEDPRRFTADLVAFVYERR